MRFTWHTVQPATADPVKVITVRESHGNLQCVQVRHFSVHRSRFFQHGLNPDGKLGAGYEYLLDQSLAQLI